MSVRTPNYITTKEIIVSKGLNDVQVLPAGSFIRPVFDQYVPDHIMERYKDRTNNQIVCYTRLGMILIKKEWIVES